MNLIRLKFLLKSSWSFPKVRDSFYEECKKKTAGLEEELSQSILWLLSLQGHLFHHCRLKFWVFPFLSLSKSSFLRYWLYFLWGKLKLTHLNSIKDLQSLWKLRLSFYKETFRYPIQLKIWSWSQQNIHSLCKKSCLNNMVLREIFHLKDKQTSTKNFQDEILVQLGK